MSSKSIAESTLEELIERKKKHIFFIHLIDAEISKRKGDTSTTKNNIFIKKTSPKKGSPKKTSPKKTVNEKVSPKNINCTRDDMKAILKRNNIKFKENSNKIELQEMVRKHNLVRIVENYHKERINT